MNSSIGASELCVFVVEPSGMQARVVLKYLGELGIRDIQVFRDGNSALCAMRSAKPDLAVSAMYLTDMSGAALIETMRGDLALADIAFILISSEDNPRYLDEVRQSGACAILSKPFDLTQLRAAIYATLDYINPGSLALDNDEADIENLRILIVDDSSSARSYLIRVLKNIGFKHFVEAQNGRDGLENLDRSTFDLVITDYNMPVMDGEAMIRAIRAQNWQRELPVIMISSEQNPQRLASVRESGVSAILNKPFEPVQIKELIERIFAG